MKNIDFRPLLSGVTFDSPVEVVPGPGGRLYVLEQAGRVKVVEPSAGAVTTALDVSDLVFSGGEAGLLGLAFDPGFAQNQTAYLHSTRPLIAAKPNVVFESVVSKVTSRDGGTTFDRATEKRLLTVEQPFSNHNGGKIAFGPDKLLYISYGDGGSGGDPLGNGQRTDVLLGKILRVDPHAGDPYGIPSTNPFARGGGRPEIFAYGLRNPWKFSFDSVTGELFCGDVGQDKFEEVDRVTLGGNFGWRVREGRHCYRADTCETTGITDPIVEYGRTDGASVTGGYVYRGARLPSLFGKFVYGDFVSGKIWVAEPDGQGGFSPRELAQTNFKISTFAQTPDGEMLVVDYATGTLYEIVPTTDSGASAASGLRLSDTGCVDVANPSVPPAALRAYGVNSPLWSDGADKERFVFVPEGAQIAVRADGDLDLPPGSVAVKTFSFGGRRIETRLLARDAGGQWTGYSYEWRDDQSDAALLDAGKTKEIPGLGTWTFPSRAQCFSCHTAAAGFTLGLEARQLNRAGASGRNQLDDFADLFAAPVARDAYPALGSAASGESAEARARGYLHANCSICHREGSGAGAATLDLRIDRAFAATRTCDVVPQAGDLGIAGAKLIAPGDPARSVVLQRMRATDSTRMPNLATHVVDRAGSSAVEDWVASLQQCP